MLLCSFFRRKIYKTVVLCHYNVCQHVINMSSHVKRDNSTFFKDVTALYASENSSILGKSVEYVVHDETDASNNYDNSFNQTEINEFRLSRFQQTQKSSKERQSHNIYLQQVPRISKCNVQLSFEGVYDNDASSDSILPAATFRNSSSQDRRKVDSEANVYSNPCIEFPLACKLLLGIIGLVLVTGAVASWSMVLTKQDSNKGRTLSGLTISILISVLSKKRANFINT